MKLRNKLWIAIGPLIILLIITGCAQTYLNLTTKNARELKVFEKENTTVVFVAMTHIAKPPYFQQVRAQIDSLRNEGFTFYYEGVTYAAKTSEKQKDTLQRKFRQLMGLTIGDYTNPDNESLPKFFRNGKYVMQTNALIGLQDKDILTDMTYNEMIEAHEAKYGKILLTNCDLETPIFDKYKCKDGNAYKKSFYAVDRVRSDYLHEQVLASKHKKIAVVYGAGHFKWFYPEMIKSGYVYKNKKLKFG